MEHHNNVFLRKQLTESKVRSGHPPHEKMYNQITHAHGNSQD